MKRPLRTNVVACSLASVLLSSSARAQEAYLQPIPGPGVEAKPSVTFEPHHLTLEHSDAGLGAGELFGAAGLQVAATGVLTGLTMLLMVATQANQNVKDRNILFITAGVLAPPILALPSSAVAHRMAKKSCPRERSWGYTYLAGVAGSALTVGALAAFAATGYDSRQDFFPGPNELALLGIALGGALVTAGLEVLALNLSGGPQVAAAPLVLKDGAGVAVGGSF